MPITAEKLVMECRRQWAEKVTVYPTDHNELAAVGIEPEDEVSLTITLYNGGMLIGMDGLPEQNVKLAAWLRSLMPEDAPRIVVGDKGFSVHAELPYGVTPEQVASSMISHSVPGWNADDPDLQWA